MKNVHVAVVGATGLVGSTILQVLAERTSRGHAHPAGVRAFGRASNYLAGRIHRGQLSPGHV